MRHPETRTFTPDQQAIYDEWLWLLTRWGTHSPDEAHELALHRAQVTHGPVAADERPLELTADETEQWYGRRPHRGR